MNWTKFKDKMPEVGSRLLLCCKVNTDPLTQPKKPIISLELVTYGPYGFFYTDDDARFNPSPEDYWMYHGDIPTPFEETEQKPEEYPVRKDKCQQCKKIISKADQRNGTLLTVPVYCYEDFKHLNPKVVGWLCYECTEKLRSFEEK